MKRKTQNRRNRTIPLACSVILGVPAVGLPALAQETAPAAPPPAGQPEKMEKVIVTGSNIPTAETVGPAPVETVTDSVVQKVGSTDVLATLKKLTPAVSGNGNTGQEVNNGGYGESYIALRNLRTLVLLNGRRLGNSSFSNGALVDLNTIPLAAIDRIEVLKDGASAIYGSDAVGGVVNIITKKDFSGVEIGGRYGTTTSNEHYVEDSASIMGGTSSEKASFTAGAQYYHRDPLRTNDREIASLSEAQLAAKDIGPTSYLSPSFPGKVQDSTGAYVLRGSPLLKGTQGYDPTVTTPPVLPGQTFSGPTAVQDYIAAVQAAGMQSPYVADPGVSLNTTQFGTHTIQSQDRANFLGSGSYDIFGKHMQVYGDFLYANIESEGALAPSPVTGLAVKQSNIFIPASNMYNPFGIDLGPNGALTPRVRGRFVTPGYADGGINGPYPNDANRLFDAQTDYYHFVGGLKGEYDNGYGYDAAYTYNRYDQMQFTRNAINGAALDQALQPNSDPAQAALGFSQLLGGDGTPVPMYNMFAAGGQNDPRTIEAIKTTLFQAGKSEQWDFTGSVHGTPLKLPGGDFAFAAGGTAGQESLDIDYDGLTKIGKVPGLNPNSPTKGRRDNWAVFLETLIPLTSPDMDIPVLHKTEVTAAFRHESFDPGGDSTVPKVGFRWQPIDEQLTLRANYSQSFIAPTTYQLFGGTAASVPFLGVPQDSDPNAPIVGVQEFTGNLSNPDLKAIDAENYGAGFVFSPKALKNLTISLDYYHIKTKNDIYRVSSQTMVDDINARGAASQYSKYYTKPDGTKLTSNAPNQANDAEWGFLEVPLMNGAEVETDGIDLTGNYLLDVSSAGQILFFANANVLLSYDYADPDSGGPFAYNGQYTDAANGVPGAQGTLPDFIVNAGFTWDVPVGQDNLAFTANAQYIPQVNDYWGPYFTLSGAPWTIDSWYRLDLQLSYEIGKNKAAKAWYDGTRLTVGVNNVTDTTPPLISSSFEDNTDKSTYDIIGRFVYFEVAKKF